MLAGALARLEAVYPFNAANLLTFVSYGIPYFRRLPGGWPATSSPPACPGCWRTAAVTSWRRRNRVPPT